MDIRVPHLAEGVESGTVVSILVKEGEKVTKDQNLLELETNKAVANIPSASEGVISKIHVQEGAKVNVGQVLVSINENGHAAAEKKSSAVGSPQSAEKPKVIPPAPAAGAYQYHSPAGVPPPASPSIRRMARDLGIDLSRVQGTENGGRITLADVRNYIAFLQQSSSSGAGAQPNAAQQSVLAKPASIDFSKWGSVAKKPLTPLRKTISEAMVNSWTTIPHVTQFDDLDISRLGPLRKKFERAYDTAGARLTVTTFILKAVVGALKKYPILNASLDESAGEIVYKDYFHIGIAVDTEHGLMVPVMRDVDKKSFLEISKELQTLAQKTRERKLSIDEMRGGTFTISNQGGIGGKHFTPIINKPEAAILGIGRAYLLNGKTVMPVGLSYDHRLIDGGTAARFIVELAEQMQQFSDSDVALKTTSAKKLPKKKK